MSSRGLRECRDFEKGCGSKQRIDAIRNFFLHPPTYPISKAATLLGIDWRDLRGWMEVGELEGVDTDEGLVLP